MKNYFAKLVGWGLVALGFFAAQAPMRAADPFPANLTGTYSAQLVAPTATTIPVGSIDFTVNSSGAAIGKLVMPDGKSYSFNAPLAVDGTSAFKTAHVVVKGAFPAGPQKLQMNLRVYADGSITGATQSSLPNVPFLLSMVNGVRYANFTGAAGNAAPWAGEYTLAATPSVSSAGAPSGSSYAAISIDSKGLMKVAGKLADGTKLTATAKPTAEGIYRIHAKPYKKGGFFSCLIEFSQIGSTGKYRVANGENAEVLWSKSANTADKVFASGFGPLVLDLTVEPWVKLGTGQSLASALGLANLQFDFDAGLAGQDLATKYLGRIPAKLAIGAKGELVPVFGDAYAPVKAADWAKIFKGSVNLKTGVYSGTITVTEATDPDGPSVDKAPLKFISRKVTFEGVIFNPTYLADGQSIASGLVTLAALPKGTVEFGETFFGGDTEPLGTGAPVVGAISPGLPGTYQMVVDQLSRSGKAEGSVAGVTVTTDLTGVIADNTTIEVSLSSDLAFFTFNGRKLALYKDARVAPNAFSAGSLIYSDVSAKSLKQNTYVINVTLGPDGSTITGVLANNVQLLKANLRVGNISVKGAPFPGAVLYSNKSALVKIR